MSDVKTVGLSSVQLLNIFGIEKFPDDKSTVELRFLIVCEIILKYTEGMGNEKNSKETNAIYENFAKIFL